MIGEIVRTFTQDGMRLEGLLCEPKQKGKEVALLHCHGRAGNFYANPFLDHIADKATSRGYAFLTFNTRGHDCLADLYKRTDSGIEHVLCGAAREAFEECIYDLGGWLDFVTSRGFDKVALQGHSAGAMKVVHYQATMQDERVKTVILLSPPDILGLQDKFFGERRGGDVRLAEQMIAEGKGGQFMPEGTFGYPVDARAYLSFAGPATKAGIFLFSRPDDPFEELALIREPILGVIGNVAEAVVNSVEECMSVLKAKAVSAAFCETVVVDGASHIYSGRERVLADTIGNWLDRFFQG